MSDNLRAYLEEKKAVADRAKEPQRLQEQLLRISRGTPTRNSKAFYPLRTNSRMNCPALPCLALASYRRTLLSAE